MSHIPAELHYTAAHQWVRFEDDGIATIGITDYAQELLGDLVFVDLPAIGATFVANDQVAIAESVKSASDVYCPLTGKVLAVNEALRNAPELANREPYAAWFFKIDPTDAATQKQMLLTAAQYAAEIGE